MGAVGKARRIVPACAVIVGIIRAVRHGPYDNGTVGVHRDLAVAAGAGKTARIRRERGPSLAVIGGIAPPLRRHPKAVSHADHVIGVQLREIDSGGGVPAWATVHSEGRGLGDIVVPHSVDIPHRAEQYPSRDGRGKVLDGGFFEAVVGEGPGDGGGRGSLDIGRAIDSLPGRVNGVIGIERVDLDVPHPSRAPRVGVRAPVDPTDPIVVITGLIGSTGIADRGPTRSPVDRSPNSIRVPPIQRGHHHMLGILRVHADAAITAGIGGRTRQGLLRPGQGGRVQLPHLSVGDVVRAVTPAVIIDP